MDATAQIASASPAMLWTGRVISALVVLFFLFDSITKIIGVTQSIEATTQLGYRESHVFGIGLLLLVCTIIYVIPQTSVLGAILLTGYMGGAIATHVRAESGLFPLAFSAIFGVLVWLGIYLRMPSLHTILPLQ